MTSTRGSLAHFLEAGFCCGPGHHGDEQEAMNSNAVNIEMLCVADPQRALSASLEARNLKDFQHALSCGADPTAHYPSTRYSVFEYVLRTAGYAEFILECIKSGAADVQKPNADGKYPIHLAVASIDPENIRVLLENCKQNIDIPYQDQTALHMLFERFKRIDEKDWEKVFACIKLLIEYKADVNIPNDDNRTPIGVFVKDSRDWQEKKQPWRKDILQYCLKETAVDVDSFREKELRTKIEKYFKGVDIPTHIIEPNIHILKAHIRSKSKEMIALAFQRFKANKEDATWSANLKELMQVAVQYGVLSFVKQLYAEGYRSSEDTNLQGLLKICCNYGYPDILKFILNTDPKPTEINSFPLLSLVIKEINISKDRGECPFLESLEILLGDGLDRIEIDKTDEKGFSALHYAVKYKVDVAVDLLLKHSAYIGTSNMFKELPICEMNPTLLEDYLDSCVTTNGKRPGDDDYEININFSCLVPAMFKKNYTGSEQTTVKQREGVDEMLPLVYMANSSDLKHLLKHPVISSYVLIKWLRLSIYFYINLLVCTAFFVSFTWYVVGYYGQDNVGQVLKQMLRIISLVGATYMLIREIGQMTLHASMYFTSIENWMEITLIVTSYTVLLKEFDNEYRQIISVIVILLSAVEFTQLVGTLPVLFISTHMVMLKTVSKNFLKSLILYSIILISFAFCFYTLFNVNNATKLNENGKNVTENNEKEDEKFNAFGDIGTALLKTFVMLTGEFEAANIKFQTNGVSYVIFVLFLFFVAIVIFNLMNGLAVSDTATIKAEAELIGLSQKVDVISKYENAIRSSSSAGMLTKIVFHIFPANLLQLFPDYIPFSYIIVAPNQSNTIYIPRRQKHTEHTENESVVQVGSNIKLLPKGAQRFKLSFRYCILPSISRMDNKIMKYAKETFLARSRKSASLLKEERLQRLEQKIERILDLISKLK